MSVRSLIPELFVKSDSSGEFNFLFFVAFIKMSGAPINLPYFSTKSSTLSSVPVV